MSFVLTGEGLIALIFLEEFFIFKNKFSLLVGHDSEVRVTKPSWLVPMKSDALRLIYQNCKGNGQSGDLEYSEGQIGKYLLSIIGHMRINCI